MDWPLHSFESGKMSAKQGALGVISMYRAKPTFCGFHLCIAQPVLSIKVFVRLFYVGAETAGALWFLHESPCSALGLETLIYEQKGNYRHSLWTGVAQ